MVTMPTPTAYSPRWFFLLEDTENQLRAKTAIQVPNIGALYLSPNYPLWDVGNCLFIDTEHPQAKEASLAAMEDAALDAQIKLNEIFNGHPRTPFYMTIDADPKSDSYNIYLHWKIILERLGYTAGDIEDESHCMTIHRSQLPQLEALACTTSGFCTRALIEDLEATIVNEPGSRSSLGWRTEKCQELLSRSEEIGRTYLCWEDQTKENAVSRFILVRHPNSPIGFIPRVNTRDEYRRKGYAKSVLVHGLIEAFRSWQDLDEVALFQSEAGPEKLYESIGMIKRGTRYDVEFTKPKK